MRRRNYREAVPVLETFSAKDGKYLVLAHKDGLVMGVKAGVMPISNHLMLIHYKLLVLRDPQSLVELPTESLHLDKAFPGVPLMFQPNKEIAVMGGVVAQPDDKTALFTKEYRKTVITIIVSYILELVGKSLTIDRARIVAGLTILYNEILKPQSNIISMEKVGAPKIPPKR